MRQEERPPRGPRGSDDRLSGAARSARQAQPYIDAGWQLAGSLVVCSGAGMWLDRRWNTTPWMLIGGAFLGFVVGMYAFWKAVVQLGRSDLGRKTQDSDKQP